MTVKLLTEQHLEFLIFRGGCTGLTESTHVKMPPCWKYFVAAIGVAPITQLRTCVIKIITLKGGHLSGKSDFPKPKGTALKGKNSLPLGANSFL